MLKSFKSFSHKAGLDASILYTISSRFIQSVGGILTLFLITRFLNTNEQGYYYTFGSILSIQVFLELGLTGIITQYVAHEFAHLKQKNSSEIEGDAYHKSRLASIVKFGVIWMISISIFLFFVFLIAGQLFFLKYNNELGVRWQLPWMFLSISTCLIVIINLFFAILEGLGKIKQVTQLRLLQQVLQLVFIGVFFVFHLNLLAGGIAMLLSTLITSIALVISGNLKIIFTLFKFKMQWKINYRKEVLPFQFKIALGSMSGYLIYQLITPVLFATQGVVVAGQMGATQACLNGILIISLSWFSTKVALFSSLVAKHKYRMLNLSYQKNLLISVAVCITGIMFFIVTVWIMRQFFPSMGNRFLTIVPIIFLGLTQVASVIGNAQAYYLRSFKKEPFFLSSIIIGLLSGTATLLSSKLLGITEITMVYFIVNGVIGFVWGCIIFKVRAYEWTKINRWF